MHGFDHKPRISKKFSAEDSQRAHRIERLPGRRGLREPAGRKNT